ncbi:MAG TPA: hypothetical protein VHE35_06865 [Kofleriaceae bacterium]|nr:hypothetical protein [Kofleriaceae bacterium]
MNVRSSLFVACALGATLAAAGCRHEPVRRAHTEAVPIAPVAPVALRTPAPAPGGPGDPVAAARRLPPPTANDGEHFADEVRQLYREVACGGTDTIADPARAKVVDAHCKKIDATMKKYQDRYASVAKPFFDTVIPASAPKVVVYPFGGGDLISALAAFPDADEVTTISLELSGDPRRISTLTPKALGASLGELRTALGGTLTVGSNTSVNLSSSQQLDLPAQVSSFLLGLSFNGYEPVDMRYFRLEDDGSIHYYDRAEIAAMDAAIAERAAAKRGKRATASSRKGDWVDPNFSEAFANVEIAYRKVGDPSGRIRIHRHIGWNLSNDELARSPQLLRHLEQKGKVTFLVKGGSYLLWEPAFSTFRQYMLDHLAWMLSDSTGIPPRYAAAAGLVQDTYGNFSGPFLDGTGSRHTRDADDFRALWRKNPHHKLAFRFGYVDSAGSAHLVVTRPGP